MIDAGGVRDFGASNAPMETPETFPAGALQQEFAGIAQAA